MNTSDKAGFVDKSRFAGMIKKYYNGKQKTSSVV
jgi:hypothetical protein